MGEIFLDDGDVRLYQGDVTDVLAGMPDESVDCVVTSPPYWGLRDYGTGLWDGGDPGCDHLGAPHRTQAGFNERYFGKESGTDKQGDLREPFKDVCGKCGARRVDQQLGLEPTPDLYVERIVAVFRQVRRVLSSHGTCFVNLGDSYASSPIPMQRVRRDSRQAGAGEGNVSTVLPPDGPSSMECGEQRTGEGSQDRVQPGEQRDHQQKDQRETTGHEGDDHGDAGQQVPMLRGDRTGVSDDRSCAERRGGSSETATTSSPQDDFGRGLPEGSLPDPLLELQLSERDAGSLPSYGDLKQKDLVGIPWMVAFALRADGWYLRSDIIWAKPNPMPESVTDRPTKAHEYVFLLTKAPRYYFDQEAVREENSPTSNPGFAPPRQLRDESRNDRGNAIPHDPALGLGRNVRSVWQIATQPYPEAHFATYPEELVRRCVLAGCPVRVCRVCGKPSERIVERTPATFGSPNYKGHGTTIRNDTERAGNFDGASAETVGWSECDCLLSEPARETRGCEHGDQNGPRWAGSESKWRPGTVLDPFIGSGTTCKVARDHGRHSIGIDLSADYLNLAARRLQQLSLLTYEPEPAPAGPRPRGLTGGAYSPPGQSPHSNARKKKH